MTPVFRPPAYTYPPHTILSPCAHRQPHQDGKLYIGNLAFKTEEDGLREAFQGYGEITFARVISDRDTGRSRYAPCGGSIPVWCGVV